nr:DUF4183 domain-containing protein [Lysinibacillus timonensis]
MMTKITVPTYLPKPLLLIPKLKSDEEKIFKSPKNVNVFEFFTVSDGCKNVFTSHDSVQGYGEQRIINLDKLSLCNLFINGVLQPRAIYTIEHEKLILKTDDIPVKGTPIILQMISIT